MTTPSYDDLSAFLVVAEAESFAAASRKLGIPTSTLSNRVSRLEEQLGLRLLHRTSRKVKLTTDGLVYFERAAPLMGELKAVTEGLIARKESLVGTLRVSAPLAAGANTFGPWLIEFAQMHKGLQIDLHLSNRYADMLEDGVDLAFRVGPLVESELIVRRLWSIPYQVVAAPSLKDEVQAAWDAHGPKAVEMLPCVAAMPVRRWKFMRALTETVAMMPKATFLANDLNLACQAVEVGLGMGYLAEATVDKALDAGKMIAIDLGAWSQPMRTMNAVYPSGRHLAPKVRQLVDFIVKKREALLGRRGLLLPESV